MEEVKMAAAYYDRELEVARKGAYLIVLASLWLVGRKTAVCPALFPAYQSGQVVCNFGLALASVFGGSQLFLYAMGILVSTAWGPAWSDAGPPKSPGSPSAPAETDETPAALDDAQIESLEQAVSKLEQARARGKLRDGVSVTSLQALAGINRTNTFYRDLSLAAYLLKWLQQVGFITAGSSGRHNWTSAGETRFPPHPRGETPVYTGNTAVYTGEYA